MDDSIFQKLNVSGFDLKYKLLLMQFYIKKWYKKNVLSIRKKKKQKMKLCGKFIITKHNWKKKAVYYNNETNKNSKDFIFEFFNSFIRWNLLILINEF